MKNLARRGLSLLLVLVMCLSLLPAIQTPAEAAVQNVTYVTGSTSQYSNIIKNWGKRGETATFLSQNAAAFYTGDNTYANFSAMDGATSTSSVSSSELYLALKSFMTSNHSNITSYDATRDLFAFTDCENSGLTTNSISCFYSAEAIGPAWDAGSTWNREHTWPKSKCIQEKANDGSDIMMLRPSKSSINSSRGNTAFGVTSGYYNPNKNLTDYDVRGDVARVLLYNYVRWGNTANMWDTDGVIESKEVLLDWMEADPVDTWELGRNDSVESITGTRNVFVDYPELAFALFNEDLPTDYTTPSGNALSTGGSYNVTFMQNGLVKDTAVSPVTLPAHYGTVPTGYNFEGWISYTITNETTTEPVFYAPGTSFSPTSDTTLHALYSMQAASSTSKWKLVTDASQLAVDASVIIAASGYNYALSTTQNKNNRGQASVTKNTTDQTLQPTADVAILTLEAGASSGTYAFNTGSGYLYAASSSSNYLRTQAAVDGNASWTITIADNQASIVANGTNTRKFMQYNQSSSLFACYSAASQKPLSLYILSADDTLAYTTSTCAHTNTTQKAEEPAKCEDPGRAAGVWCNDCESFIEGGNILAPSGHDYEAVVTPPTTTAQGYTTYTCKNDSSHSYVADYVDALSYTVSFSVPAGVAKPADVHCNSTAFNLPTPTGAPLGDLHEYSFVGWAEAAVDNQEEAPKLFTGKYSTDESITLYAIYSYTVGGSSSDFTLVTDASQLTLGASVIIAATDSNFALSTTQNNNNRGQAAVTKNTANNTLEPTTNVAILTLEEGKVSGTYAFNTGTGYLYAASSKSNHLKTQTTLNDNGSWLITVDSNGIATVKAQGTNTRNWMRYNSSNNPPLFSCYGDGQADISLYIRTGAAGTTYYTSDIDLGAVEDGTLKFKGVNLTLKDSQYLNFNALQSVVDQYENVYAVLEADGKQIAVVTDPFTHTDKDGNVRYNYSFQDLTVLDFGLEVKATLYGTKGGKLYCSPTVSYTLLQYCTNAIANKNSNDRVPCAYLLKYVQAAEAYKNVDAADRIAVPSDLDSLLNANIEAAAPSQTVTVNNGQQVTFKGQHLQMEAKLNLEVKVLLKDTNVDTSKVTLTVAYKDVYNENVTKEYAFADLVASTDANVYLLAIKDLYASQMGETVTVTIAIDGVVESTLQTSIESYCTAIAAGNYSASMKELAKRIFLYGEAVKAAYAS